jgi:arylsulfatase A-like enzyme
MGLGEKDDYLTDKLTDAALAFIDSAKNRPFFLYLAHHAPHTPIEAPQSTYSEFLKKRMPDDKHQNAGYAAMVANLDENVGRVLDHIQKRGLADNTIVVFTSDNGGYIGVDRRQIQQLPCTSNHPLRSGKGSLYEGGIRVPLIVRWPGTQPGERRQPVVTMDLFATLRGAAMGPGTEESFDGVDLSPLLKNGNQDFPPRELYWHYPHYYETTTPVSAVRSGNWKLLEYFEDGRRELYDLESDPYEARNVADQQSAQAVDLGQRLTAWRESVGAKLPRLNSDYRAK